MPSALSPELFDYLIIGGGSAGCVLAARLSEDPQVRVALLEAGAQDTNVLIHCPLGMAALALTGQANWKFETVPQAGLNGRRGYQPRGKVLGGSSSLNAMIYIRGQREDYDHWAAQGNPGWSYDEVLPYFLRAEDNARGASAWHGVGGPLHVMDLRSPNPLGPLFVQAAGQAGHALNPDFNGARQEGVGLYQVTQQNGERHSAAKAYLAPHTARPNLLVLTQAQTCRVLIDNRRAVGVEFVQHGQTRQLRARREVLLCAGALQSPQLLLLSGIGPQEHVQQHGITLQHALPGVGRNLQDHLDVVQVLEAPRLSASIGISLGGALRTARAIGEWRKLRSGLLTSNAAEAGGFIKSAPGEATPDLQLHFVVAKIINHARTLVWGHGLSCHLCLLRPQSRGSVQLASSNPLVPPLIDPNFLAEADDLRRLVQGFKQMRALWQQPALAQLGGKESARSASARSDQEIAQFIRSYGDTIYHPVGTCRMGPGAMDVVDARLRVHGMAGLRVVDASIMPRIISGNTNAATIMVAEKAADMIKADAR